MEDGKSFWMQFEDTTLIKDSLLYLFPKLSTKNCFRPLRISSDVRKKLYDGRNVYDISPKIWIQSNKNKDTYWKMEISLM